MWIAFGFFLAFAIGFAFGMMVEGTLAAAEQADQQIENIPEQAAAPVRLPNGVLAAVERGKGMGTKCLMD